MWLLKYLFISALILKVFCETETNYAIELSPDTFEDAIKENNHFVMFYAPWCGHCKKLHPLWEQLAEMLNIENPRVLIAKVDCTVHQKLCASNQVTGYPTLRFFKLGSSESVKFKGTRDFPTISDFIQEQIGEPANGNAEKPDASEPTQKLFELTEDTFTKHISTGKHFIKFYAPWCSHCQKLAPTWEELAKSFENENRVKIAKIDCTAYRPICQNFEVKSYPTLLWIEEGKKVEKYSGSRSHDDLKMYVGKMLDNSDVGKEGDVEKTKSEDEEITNVTILSAENFEQAVEKGVTFVKFYAPWCGHCQKLNPIWEQLGSKMAGKTGIKIAKVDCTLGESKNLCAEQQVEGYPTLFIYKNGEKLKEYNGHRQLDDLLDFAVGYLEKHDEL